MRRGGVQTRHQGAVHAAPADDFADAVLAGLSKPQKAISSQFLYDARGSALFEEITGLPEYYPTRTETAILSAYAAEMVDGLGADGVLVEFGSGSSVKTEFLLSQLRPGVVYVPVDVSESALYEAAQRLSARFPTLDVRPVAGNFSHPIRLPEDLKARPAIGFFPGSTIGNFGPPDAVRLLRSFGRALPDVSRFIIGVDLKKEARRLVAAYNDREGVTAAFNLNLLVRINRELAGDFDVESFRHEAIYDPRAGRIEMHLVSDVTQDVHVLGCRFRFKAGESIHTENSYKYTAEQFREMAGAAGWHVGRLWTDANTDFSVHELFGFGKG
ncbi:methyltransferase [Hyphomicrobium nitrativorans NL23]|uniref:Methyltransferase n=1 Tax=Hyphomicrobium nitrativorans NL23 TaxID=1029756 RepID=V5SCX1_9HYPH|nr:L-histidine N(alpha)-methyltransferase [Hyphomicrobium nitrativorans]AHB48322.1 methyltransferase [Hyphomicrobium nitrativorans NL23]